MFQSFAVGPQDADAELRFVGWFDGNVEFELRNENSITYLFSGSVELSHRIEEFVGRQFDFLRDLSINSHCKAQ